MRHARKVLMLSAAVVILLASVAVEASEPMKRSEGSGPASAAEIEFAANAADTPVKILGVQVFIDPKTGLIRTPSPEEAAGLAAEMQRRFGGPLPQAKAVQAPVVLANGTLMQQLDPSLMNVSIARIHADGSLSFDCVKGHDHEIEDAAAGAIGPETE